MTGLSHHLAEAETDDRLRRASEHRRAQPLGDILGRATNLGERQRSLVRLSLLFSRRSDPATARRRP
jgi:hypothetical protein